SALRTGQSWCRLCCGGRGRDWSERISIFGCVRSVGAGFWPLPFQRIFPRDEPKRAGFLSAPKPRIETRETEGERGQMIVPVKGVAAMSEGDALPLVAEPENQYDPHAIRVEHGGRRIGYLAKELAARITADAYEASVAYVLRYENVPAGLRILLNRREKS